MSTEVSKDVVRRSYTVYATGDLDALDHVMAVDYIDHNPVPDQAPGIAGVKAKIEATRKDLSEIDVAFDDQVAEGDKVASRITLRARHDTGADVVVRLIAISQVVDGKIVAEWGIADTSGS
jgi:ketosteroid isomerase-like protein